MTRRSGRRHGHRLFVAGASVAVAMFLPWWSRLGRAETRNNQRAATAVREEKKGADPRPVLGVADYDRLLHTYVTDDGWVDYVGLGRERGALNLFIKELGTVSPNGFKDNAERLAFWINSYNAFTVADALNKVYGKHQSVRQVGGFFDGQRHLVAGEQLTLDEIEKRGRDLHDPRIHFAIVCASASCPKLQGFAYTGQAEAKEIKGGKTVKIGTKGRATVSAGAVVVATNTPINNWGKIYVIYCAWVRPAVVGMRRRGFIRPV